jgi:hypothetical protein
VIAHDMLRRQKAKERVDKWHNYRQSREHHIDIRIKQHKTQIWIRKITALMYLRIYMKRMEIDLFRDLDARRNKIKYLRAKIVMGQF